MRKILLILAVLAFIAGIAWLIWGRGGPEEPTFPGDQGPAIRQQVTPPAQEPAPAIEPVEVTEPVEPEEQVESGQKPEAGEIVQEEAPEATLKEFTMPAEDTSVVIDLEDQATVDTSVGIVEGAEDYLGIPDFDWIPPEELRKMAGSNEDPVVNLDFVDNLARHVVVNYYPQRTHPQAQNGPVTLLNIKTINLRYGVQMTGLRHSGADIKEARRQILGYVFGPAMRVVYSLYADRFVELVETYAGVLTREFPESQGGVRRLIDEEKVQLFQVNARWARDLAKCVRAVAKLESLEELVRSQILAERAAIEANNRFGVALHVFQELQIQAGDKGQLSGETRAKYEKAEDAANSAGKAYQQSVKAREQATQSLGDALLDAGSLGLDEGSSLYIAKWFYRRHLTPEKRKEIANLSAELLLDMADRLDAAVKL